MGAREILPTERAYGLGEGNAVKSNRVEEGTPVDCAPFLVGVPFRKPQVESTLLEDFSLLFCGWMPFSYSAPAASDF